MIGFMIYMILLWEETEENTPVPPGDHKSSHTRDQIQSVTTRDQHVTTVPVSQTCLGKMVQNLRMRFLPDTLEQYG